MNTADPLRAGLGFAFEVLSVVAGIIALGYANHQGWLPW